MIKSNLPVILLKNLVLLPYQEVRVEIKSDVSKKVTEISKQHTTQNRTKQKRIEYNRIEQNRIEQNRTEQNRIE